MTHAKRSVKAKKTHQDLGAPDTADTAADGHIGVGRVGHQASGRLPFWRDPSKDAKAARHGLMLPILEQMDVKSIKDV